ncbi:hypothetical protein [Gemmobacter serpentinus]|uniref:hypothetical protein n=1 Tax=Gemmobacter serpentinus TaxID=2652247 RepID=UPI00124F5CBF|nr:hypothetical protein [Gemmobacter serpentinus]
MPASLAAQDGRARVIESADPPRGTLSSQAQRIVATEGARSDMTYALRITGDLAEGRDEVLPPDRRDSGGGMALPRSGPISTGIVILVVLGLLLLWLRFGGAGMLMARAPEAERKPTAAPDAWNISIEDQAGDPRSLIDQIAAMSDRSAALVRLLRHCLLTAASETDTRLLRADTERIAYRRLPGTWRQAPALAEILRRAELAHYGGQPVSEPGFAATLEMGRAILLESRGHHA